MCSKRVLLARESQKEPGKARRSQEEEGEEEAGGDRVFFIPQTSQEDEA